MTAGAPLADRDEDTCESAMSSPSATPNPPSTLASKRKTKKKHFVQQKVEVLRASDPVLSVLMWGVNHSVGAWSRRPARTLSAWVRASVCASTSYLLIVADQ